MVYAKMVVHRNVGVLSYQTWMSDELNIARVALNCVTLTFSFIPHIFTFPHTKLNGIWNRILTL